MATYSIDQLTFEKKDDGIHVFIRGWASLEDFNVVLYEKDKELAHFASNESRYDVCPALNEEIHENTHGFKNEIVLPKKTRVVSFYLEKDKEKILMLTKSASGEETAAEKRNIFFKQLKAGISQAWHEYHFLVPPSAISRAIRKKKNDERMGAVFDPLNPDEYNEWLKTQKAGHDKDTEQNVTFITAGKAGKFKGHPSLHMDVLDLSEIHTDYVCFVGDQCSLYPAFYSYLKRCEKYDLLYFDNDQTDASGKRMNPKLKPGFSYDTLRGFNYIGNVWIVKKSLLKELDHTPVDLYRYLLMITDRTTHCGHVSRILYCDNSQETCEKEMVERYLDERKVKATVTVNPDGISTTVRYDVEPEPLVSIIIPTKDHKDDLKKCLDSIYEKTVYKNFEILVLDNNSEKEDTYAYFRELEQAHDNLHVILMKCPFNFAYLNNTAVKDYARGEYILMLNNDTELLSPDWLGMMVGYASRNNVAEVGAKLFFPDHTIQHAGVLMGKGGIAGHVHYGDPQDAKGYRYELEVPYDVSCVTAACLMISKEKYLEAGGMNEDLQVAFNDVDFGLRLLHKGYFNVVLPSVNLYHYESKSRGAENTDAQKYARYMNECQYMRDHWQNDIVHDHFYNKNFSREHDYRLRMRWSRLK